MVTPVMSFRLRRHSDADDNIVCAKAAKGRFAFVSMHHRTHRAPQKGRRVRAHGRYLNSERNDAVKIDDVRHLKEMEKRARRQR